MRDRSVGEPKRTKSAAGSGSAKRSGRTRPRKAKAVVERTPVQGWKTSDEEEIALRQWRGRTDVVEVAAQSRDPGFFGLFRARSESGGAYDVEIRSLNRPINSCGCIDHRVNGLGTCKHIEGVLAALQHRKARAFRDAATAGSPKAEIFLDRSDGATPTLLWPRDHDGATLAPAREWLRPWLDDDANLAATPERIEALLAAWPDAPEAVRATMRVSVHFGAWIERARRAQDRREARAAFEADVAAGRATLDLLAYPLLPYQRLGALHLAFGERALLADDMGLGKTIQAIAACELLARRKGVERILVVCPASLKAEWEEQIARFSGRSTRLAFGGRAQRLAAYREPTFFTIVNYEQVIGDADDINAVLKPDVVVLDEAQRIKNWRTKTAWRVKSLRAPYAFVLTGTPVENRIDELYSIVQFLDPEILGPLFRFNRDFYELDERGRPVDYKNLGELRERVAPVMLRRRKAEVERELPGRTVKTYFTPMTQEQKTRYEDYRQPAARLIAQAQKRPLRQQEFERLQQLLACMRMVCDTPAILDPTCRDSPKLEELERVIEDLMAEDGRKIIIFSEWERMLTMVRELIGQMGLEAAWHTGSLSQERRRAEINRFKQDPRCRVFLSTDSGSVGLNLQVASAVVNVDLPWNPARLEQRIARAWRKNQTRSVAVINLVAENSIEHSILHLIGQKQALADGLVDGEGDLAALKMPSGRGAFIERMQAMMSEPKRPAPRVLSAQEALVADLVQRHGDKALLVEARKGADGRARLVVVLDIDTAALAAETERNLGDLDVDFLDKASWLTMQRLVAAGLIGFAHEAQALHRSPELAPLDPAPNPDDGRAMRAMAEADRSLRMARVLLAGGFADEASPLLAKSLRCVASALIIRRGHEIAVAPTDDRIRALIDEAVLPAEVSTVLEAANSVGPDTAASDVEPLIAATARILATVRRNEPSLVLTAMS